MKLQMIKATGNQVRITPEHRGGVWRTPDLPDTWNTIDAIWDVDPEWGTGTAGVLTFSFDGDMGESGAGGVMDFSTSVRSIVSTGTHRSVDIQVDDSFPDYVNIILNFN